MARALQLGRDYVLSIQRPDGSWYGSWGVCFTYGTWFGVEALAAAAPCAQSRQVGGIPHDGSAHTSLRRSWRRPPAHRSGRYNRVSRRRRMQLCKQLGHRKNRLPPCRWLQHWS